MSQKFKPWKDLPQHTGCTSNLEQARDWIRECDQSDDRCNRYRQFDYLPTRVIDVSRQEDKIFVTEADGCQRGRYIALSHCWGNFKPIQTTVVSLPKFRTQGINLESLPRTFRDAVLVARFLDCPFLWIDSLCIIQGDREDWAREAPRMAEVYSNSYLTVAAVSSADCTGGLFYQNDERQVKYEIKRELEDGTSMKIYVRPAIDHSPIDQGLALLPPNPLYPAPLLHRGWFFQEFIFSPRILFFTNWEILWQCYQRLTCICEVRNYRDIAQKLYLKDKLEYLLPNGSWPDLHWLWSRLISAYTRRQLTYDSDRLAALSAVTGLMSNTTLGRYISGLWESSLAACLTWSVAYPGPGTDPPIRRSTDTSVPSWSWASVIGPVRMPLEAYPTLGFEITNFIYDPGKTHSLVEASARAIILRGMVCECRVWCPRYCDHPFYDHTRSIQAVGMENECSFTVDVGSEVSCDRAEAMLAYVLKVSGDGGIVLFKLDNKEDTYRRIGYIGSGKVDRMKFTLEVLELV
ncbi:HET-domain-containing protein [Hypoxylon sp. FL0890]|nr:HET-domain-containing protein [Hypoxylon sp. FL0890]